MRAALAVLLTKVSAERNAGREHGRLNPHTVRFFSRVLSGPVVSRSLHWAARDVETLNQRNHRHPQNWQLIFPSKHFISWVIPQCFCFCFFPPNAVSFWECAKWALDEYFCLEHKVRLQRGFKQGGRLLVKFTFRLEGGLLGWGRLPRTALYPVFHGLSVIRSVDKLVTTQPWFSYLKEKAGLEPLRFLVIFWFLHDVI